MSPAEDGGAVEGLVERLRNAPFPNGWTQHPETLDIAETVLDAANRIEDDAAEITRLRAEVERMREALDEIANPIAAIQRRAKKVGAIVDGGTAVFLSNDVGYLKGIARSALGDQP